MKKGIILYQSKYGSTRKYAQWLSDKTGFPQAETKKASPDDLSSCDVIVLGGGLYASGIAGVSFLKKNWQRLKGKKIAVFCVGASPADEKVLQQVAAHNLKDSLSGLPCFYCRGAWDEDAMTLKDRALCKLLQKAVAKKDPASYEPWETALMEAMGQRCDWTDPSYLEPLLRYLAD